jgi:hypothetical protein
MNQVPDRTGPDPRRVVSLANISDEDAAELLEAVEAVEAYYEEGRQLRGRPATPLPARPARKALIAARTTTAG